MTDFEDQLRQRMRAEVSGVRPEDRLGAIRRRTEQSSRSTWWVPIASGLAALSLVAAAVVGVAASRNGAVPGQAAGSSEEKAEKQIDHAMTGPERLVKVWVLREQTSSSEGEAPRVETSLYPATLSVPRTDNPGTDAVEALLRHDPARGGDPSNIWHDGLPGQPLAVDVRSVEHRGGLVTVDFGGVLDDPWPTTTVNWEVDPSLFPQQLVRTVQDAYDTTDPVVVTQDGDPVDAVLGVPVSQPLTADDDALPSVYVTWPDGTLNTSGRVLVDGRSNTFEGTVNWRVLEGDDVVREGYAMGGSYGEWKRFSFELRLPPGSYTLEVFEASAEDGSQQSVTTFEVNVDRSARQDSGPTHP